MRYTSVSPSIGPLCAASARRLPIGFAAPSDVRRRDRRERDECDGVDLDLPRGPVRIAATLLDLWPLPRRQARDRGSDGPERRRDLLAQLDRLRDLYVTGDLTKSQYVMRRQALEEEVGRIGSPADPDVAEAEALLDNFAQFWALEVALAERRKLLAQLFDRTWQDDGTIVAVKPRAPFARYFATVAASGRKENLEAPSGASRCQRPERPDSVPR